MRVFHFNVVHALRLKSTGAVQSSIGYARNSSGQVLLKYQA